MLPQNSPIKLNLTQPRPYPGCQSFFFFLLLVAKIERRSRDRVTTYRRQSFHRNYRNTAHEIRHSSISQHFPPFLHTTAPRADMSNYENKQIPQKTGLASYLVSKSHGSAVRNCRDLRVFFPLATRSRLRRLISQPTTGKKPSGTQDTPTQNHPKNQMVNRPFARWRHFTTTTRILFVFPFTFKFGNPSEV